MEMHHHFIQPEFDAAISLGIQITWFGTVVNANINALRKVGEWSKLCNILK